MTNNPLLPQQDPDQQSRKEQLAARQAQLLWDQKYLPPLAMLYAANGSGPSLGQSIEWAEVGVYTKAAEELPGYIAGRAVSLDKVIANLSTADKSFDATAFTSIQQYALLFGELPVPRFVETWSQDFEFAYQRLGGVNPLSIRKIAAIPANFAITDERLTGLLRAGVTLESEARAGRLFLCDYSILEGLPSVTDQHGTRSVLPVLALFHVDAGDPRGARLAPLAIQLGLEAREAYVFTPMDGKAWVMAKICAQCADASYHEMGLHLLGTHFMEEAFSVAFNRQVAMNHPVYKLVIPHFQQLEANNFAGRQHLINPSGPIDELMGGTIETSLLIVARTYSGYPARGVLPWSFEEWDLPLSIVRRGVGEIPDYPFRDDGMLVWKAIESFVTAYLNIYYKSDADVVQDYEIQAWMRDLTAPEGGHVRGVPSTLESIPQLVSFLTRLIFACGPLHSAINFSQYGSLAFAPNMPLALYATVPADARALSDEQITAFILELLPPPANAVNQLNTIGNLTSKRVGQLGQYPGAFTDASALAAVAAFQRDLAAIEVEVDRRNVDRQLRGLPGYGYLLPSLIAPSTSI